MANVDSVKVNGSFGVLGTGAANSRIGCLTVLFDGIAVNPVFEVYGSNTDNEAISPGVLAVSLGTVNDKTVAVLTFGGCDVDFGSLCDGNWELAVDGNVVAAFGRLFGDLNGDRQVGNDDEGQMLGLVGLDANMSSFIDGADFDNDGLISSSDRDALIARLRKSLD